MAEGKRRGKITKIRTETELIKLDSEGTIHFPICQNPDCGRTMDWLQVFEDGKLVHESAVCPKCSMVELKTLSVEGVKHLMKIYQNTKSEKKKREGRK